MLLHCTIEYVILSEARSAKSKNLRIIGTSVQLFGAKILRLASLAQDDSLGRRYDKHQFICKKEPSGLEGSYILSIGCSRGFREIDVDIAVAHDTGHFTLVGILPHTDLIGKIHPLGICCQPELIVLQFLQIQVLP